MKPKVAGLILPLLIPAVIGVGAERYWDTSPDADRQGGDGVWSLDPAHVFWNPLSSGTGPLTFFSNNDNAHFLDNDGPSRLVVEGVFSNNSANVRGAGYTIVMTNGAQLTCSYAGGADFYLGRGLAYGSSSGNTWIVAGGSSAWTTRLHGVRTGGTTMHIGGPDTGAVDNVLVVDGGGVPGSALVTNGGAVVVGALGARDCGIRVLRGGSIQNPNGSIQLGTLGSTRCFLESDGGTLRTGGLQLYGGDSSARLVNRSRYSDGGSFVSLIVGAGGWATNGVLLVDDSEVLHAGSGDFKVAGNGSMAILTNGALVNLGGGNNRYVGETSSNCSLVVAGGGTNATTLLLGANVLTVGLTGGRFNEVRVDGAGVAGGAVVTNGRVTVGSGAAATDNRLAIVNGGRFVMSSGAALIGSGSSRNVAEVLGGAGAESLWNGGNQILHVGYGAAVSNGLLVDGRGEAGSAVVSNATLCIGYNGPVATPCAENYVVVTNGGVMHLGAGNNWGHGGNAHVIGAIGNNVYASPSNRLEIVAGGRVYARAQLFVGFNFYNGTVRGNRLEVRGDESLLDMGGFSILAPHSYPQNAVSLAGVEVMVDGGTITNAGGFIMPNRAAGSNLHDNRLVVTNGGRFFMAGHAFIGATGGTNNRARVTGSGSRWDLGLRNLTIGLAGHEGNGLVIDQGGCVDQVGQLTVVAGSEALLRGGTLGAVQATLPAVPFSAGDGVQPAFLKGLGGVLLFPGGLRIEDHARLGGAGTVSGAGAGVELAPGAVLDPGVEGAGVLTVGGSGLTWGAGSEYRCDVTNVNLGPGLGWDFVNVMTQSVWSGATTIRMDSRGSPPGGFDAGADYTLRILGFGGASGPGAASLQVDTTAFLPGGAWSVTNVNNSLYLVYRGGAAAPAADYTWAAPASGSWSQNGNWAGGVAPGAGGGALALAFGDTGAPYQASNDLAGVFGLEQLRLTSVSTVTNHLRGGALELNGAGARLDFRAGAGGFQIGNGLWLGTNTLFGGNAVLGATVTLAGAVTNRGTLTKRGGWVLAFTAAKNEWPGPLVVDSPDGGVRVDHVDALKGAGAVLVSNGLLAVNQGAASWYFANGVHNREGAVTGGGSIWSNRANAANQQSGYALGATNVRFAITGGGRHFWPVRLHAFNTGSRAGRLEIAGGGQLHSSTYEAWLAYGATDCVMQISGTGSVYNAGGQAFNVSLAGAENRLLVEAGGLATNLGGVKVEGGAGSGNRLVVTNGGRLFNTGTIHLGALAGAKDNRLIVTGAESCWHTLGNAVYFGVSGSTNNELIVEAGGVAGNFRLIGGGQSNRVRVASGGQLTAYALPLYVSWAGGTWNRIEVEGAGSLLDAKAQTLYVSTGAGSSFNRLTVSAGGQVTNVAALIMADGADSSNNTVLVDGGTLQAASLAFNNGLPNEVVLTGGGLAAVNAFSVTQASQRVFIRGGEWRVQSALVSNQAPFVVGDGVQEATLRLLPSATPCRFVDGLEVTNRATLAGAGYIQGSTTVRGTLSPGSPVGALTNSGAVALMPGSMTVCDLAAATVPGGGWDCLTVTNGTLALGGTLRPVLADGFEPAPSGSFLVMTNATADLSGVFENAGDGGSVRVYGAADSRKAIGLFRVEIGARHVRLYGYDPGIRPDGALIWMR